MALAERTVSPTWDYQPTTTPPYVTVAPATESDPTAVASLWAAVGTAAPTQWIGPNTLALALGYLRPFRSDPFFFDPDLFVVGKYDERWVVTVNVRVPSNYPLVATAVNAAFAPYRFYGVLAPEEPEGVTTTFVSHNTCAPTTPTATEIPEDQVPAPDSFAELASQAKERSGLTDEQLGKIFPVTREQFQRWRTGKEDRPSTAHIRRMAALNEMFTDAATRVETVRDWLLIPSGGLSPYDLLCQARFEEVWRLLTQSPSSVASRLRLAEDGAWEQVPRVAVRSSNEPDNSPPITVSDDDDE
jgi:hypothetical protein